MSLWEAALLGLVQGLTEFLPVSSSGHLALARMLAGGRAESGPLFEVAVHVGTLFAILVIFRPELRALIAAIPRLLPGRAREGGDPERGMIGLLILSALPAGVVGLLLRDVFDHLVADARVVGGCLMATGLILLLGRRFARESGRRIDLPIAVAMGLAQALAILPGISRSGSTIAAGLVAGGSRPEVGRFAFLMAIIPIGGAGLLEAKDALEVGGSALPWTVVLVGLLVSFLSGLVALRVLLTFVARGRLHLFAAYCLVVGALAVGWGLVR